ncbi:MAG TPA: hypothetical protein VES39_06195, partial [Rhodospirillales bacterium]|nr:hypothetical protein [Rhodospirillales bacterium]
MQVDTPLALYTLVLGWQVYNELWEVLSQVGIVFLPFMGVFFTSFFLDRERGHPIEGAPRLALVVVEARVFLMFMAAIFCAVPAPMLALTPGLVSYAPTSTGPL